ncbi:hypothetical protein DSO57_1000036 [Entomophthora muscae]|uniref:Uncharacterized protein n=1 Tax=Entomophthora muscae TaxID=34485 RepID=A0ACC2SM07_9FUNG|nr:hypothetical protein DSO57_1000036 [Entomophthora muscae]
MLEYLGLLASVVDNVFSVLFHLAVESFAVPWPTLYSASPTSFVSNFPLQMLFSISVLVANFCYTSKGSKLRCLPFNSYTVLDPKQQVRELFNKVIDIQATVYTSAYKAKTLELSPFNALCAPVFEFNIRDQALYYQHQIDGCAHKLDSLWVVSLTMIFNRGPEYTVKINSSGWPFAWVHAKFLRAYHLLERDDKLHYSKKNYVDIINTELIV